MEFGELRKKYRSENLRRKELSENPFAFLKKWLKEAFDQGVEEANAMVLATCTKNGAPSSRTVLLKEIDDKRLVFFTNYESRKGKEISENPFASATFYWKELDRQVTVDGRVEKISREESARYFAGRPKESQIAAFCSQQGEAISSRDELVKNFEKAGEEFAGKEVPLPDFWGGYQILPTLFIFWQGHDNRLHDRFRYMLQEDGSWKIDRIKP